MKTKTTEANKLQMFHAYQARLVKLWQAAGMDVPNDFEGNLVHYAMCEVIDRTEPEDLPERYIGFNTEREPLIEIGRAGDNGLEKAFTVQGYDNFEEADKASPDAEYLVVVRCRTCHCVNHAAIG